MTIAVFIQRNHHDHRAERRFQFRFVYINIFVELKSMAVSKSMADV